KSWWPFFDKYEKNSGGSQTAAAKPAAKAADKSAAKSEAPATASSAPPAARENLRGVSPSSAESETLKAETKSGPQVTVKETAPKRSPEESLTPTRGPVIHTAKNMDDSVEVPTASSVRALPAKGIIGNRIVINSLHKRTRGGKVSYTHLIGYA